MGHSVSTHTHTHIKPIPVLMGMGTRLGTGTCRSCGYGNPEGVTVSTWSILGASACSDGGRVLEHGLPPRTLTVYLNPPQGQVIGMGMVVTRVYLVGRV